METLLKTHPEYKILGKAKFVKLATEEGIDKCDAIKYFDS
jgi:hypothetical protein